MAESSYDNASLRRSLGIHTAEQQEALPVMEAFAAVLSLPGVLFRLPWNGSGMPF